MEKFLGYGGEYFCKALYMGCLHLCILALFVLLRYTDTQTDTVLLSIAEVNCWPVQLHYMQFIG